jgi:hypothetical protein
MDKIEIKESNTKLLLNLGDIQKATEWEEFVSLWTISQEIDQKNQWCKGDIANRITTVHGEESLKKFAEEVKESYATMQHFRRVSRAYPQQDMRDWNLSWTHYLIASFADAYNKGEKKFDSDNRFKWLESAHDNGWNTGRLEAEIKKQGAIKDDKDYFDYYMEYLNKVRNILLHVEKSSITDDGKAKLYNHLSDTLTQFGVYLKE